MLGTRNGEELLAPSAGTLETLDTKTRKQAIMDFPTLLISALRLLLPAVVVAVVLLALFWWPGRIRRRLHARRQRSESAGEQ
ncbi:hypothetical protein GA0074694_3563 [Micromonospora inyonensis]|uniref:Uncharacterized protein n=2 Tax=Micromonospora inyonensis TaxID=47866 RepID=A0A1C6S172_9ACTN|nr:hypothetical protein GA0074694_3563 [Micromonospora inyonensis]